MSATSAAGDRGGPGRGGNRLARGGLLNMGGSAVAAAAQFVLVGVVARNVDDTVAGAFFVLVAFAQLVVVLPAFGAGTGLVYFLSRRRATADVAGLGPVLRTALTPVLVLSVVCGALVLALADPLARLLSVADVDGGVAALRVMALAVPAFALLQTLSSACRGLGSYAVTVATEQLLVPVGQLVLVLFTTGAGLLAMTAGWTVPVVAAAAVAAAGLAVLYRRAVRSTERPRIEAATGERTFWGYTTPVGIMMILKGIVQRADVIALGALAAPVQVVLYVAASRYLVLGQVANRAMSLTVQPRVAAATATGDRPRAQQAYVSATAWLILVSWPVSLGCLLFPGTLLEIVGGPTMRAGIPVLVILSSAMLVAAACGNVESVLAMLGRSRFNLLTAVAGATTNVVLLVLLIPRFGPEGAAWAWAAAILVSNVWPTVALARLEGMHPFGRPTVLAMAVSVTSTVLVGGAVRVVGGDRPAVLVVAVVLAAATQLALVALLRRPLGLGRGRRAPAVAQAT